jgi:hypothetical protein
MKPALARLLCAAGAALVLSATPADAMIYSLSIFENTDGVDVSGLDLWVDVIDGGSYVDFEFHNDSLVNSFISSVYIENAGASLSGSALSGGSIVFESTGVNFSNGSTPPNPPGAIGGWGGNAYAVNADSPSSSNGINPGEWMTLRMDYEDANYGEILSMISTGDLRLAQHIQGIGQSSVWGTTGDEPGDPVPLPASVWLLGSGFASWLGGGALRRRKKRS